MKQSLLKLNGKKAFTLLEILIVVFIITLLSIISVVIFEIQREKVRNLDNTVSIFKDSLLTTQNYAFAPHDLDAEYYVFAINLSNADEDYSIDPASPYILHPKDYAIFWTSDPENPTQNPPIKKGGFNQNVTFTSDNPDRSATGTGILSVLFRVSDGSPGFQGFFPEDTEWSGLWNPAATEYASIVTTEVKSGFTKTIKIQKITGEINVD